MDPLHTRRTRRQLLAAISGLTVVSLAAACGAAGSPTAAPSTTGGSTSASSAATGPASSAATSAGSAPAAAGSTSASSIAPSSASSAASSASTAAISISGPFEGEAKSLDGAGATFPAALYTKWFSEYEKLTGVKVNYQSIGSGGGIKSISDGTVDFGATDGPMTDEQLKAAKDGEIFHIPAALGAVVPTYNIPGSSAALKFTSETLAGIYFGEIRRWNDPKLLADNPSLSAVDKDIIVVHRSDGSGTTYIWVDYLSTVSKPWQDKVGRGTSVKWPVGLGGKGNEGVAGEVKQNAHAIGYVELIYALQNKLGVGQVRNRAGRFIEPSLESVTEAAAGVAKSIAPDLRASIVDAEGDGVYPVSGFTWLLIYRNLTDRAKGLALTRMAWWAVHDAQKFNKDLGYAPIPKEITARSDEKIKQIAVDGKPVFPGR